jgi:integrase
LSDLKNKLTNILKAEQIKALQYSNDEKKKNSLNDGAGLRIVVNKDNKKVWKFIYTLNGIRKDTSFGTFPKVTLAGARIKAKEFRDLLEKHIDPLEDKKEQKKLQQETKKQKQHQINIIVNRYFELEQHNKGLADITVRKTIERLENHFYPHLKEKEKTIIHNISFDDIVKALNVLEKDNKLETLSRIKRVIVNVFIFAYTEQILKDESLAGRVALKKFKIQRKENIKGNPTLTKQKDIKNFYNSILTYDNKIVRYALLLTIHTAQRQGSIRTAKWIDFDFDNKVWIIPAENMKVKKEHNLPLSNQMIDYLKELYLLTGTNQYLFPNQQYKNKYMSENTVNNAIRKMGFTEEQQTAHGLRAMFKTVCKENQTKHNLNNEFVERILAHKTEGAVEGAYNRAENIEDMRVIIQWWSDYLTMLRD